MIDPRTIDILNFYHDKYNSPQFITDDPVSVPHRFSQKQDIEIAGLLAATISWGVRKTILNNCTKMLEMMDNSPYQFILHQRPKDLKPLSNFVHRTFNGTDMLYFVHFLRAHYKKHDSLEVLFKGDDVYTSLCNYHNTFTSLKDFPDRTKKHVATPERKSTCKRINMYIRII
jgi:uncharacterized protein (TIGR02757 family)